uniref:Uncharacterized protein n=1 Tax=Chenopodium quinoa TaxID=63459 RepID=A0A803N9K0_CHEQI
MQGVQFSANVFLLPLSGSDLVPGIQWFSLLGPVLWDFIKLTRESKYKGKKIRLRGSSPKSWKIVKPLKFQKLLAQEGTLSMMQIQPGDFAHTHLSAIRTLIRTPHFYHY